jgi:hypothetical protein
MFEKIVEFFTGKKPESKFAHPLDAVTTPTVPQAPYKVPEPVATTPVEQPSVTVEKTVEKPVRKPAVKKPAAAKAPAAKKVAVKKPAAVRASAAPRKPRTPKQ